MRTRGCLVYFIENIKHMRSLNAPVSGGDREAGCGLPHHCKRRSGGAIAQPDLHGLFIGRLVGQGPTEVDETWHLVTGDSLPIASVERSSGRYFHVPLFYVPGTAVGPLRYGDQALDQVFRHSIL
jgi:hypothetical protein